MVIVSRVFGKIKRNLWNKTENALVQGGIGTGDGNDLADSNSLHTKRLRTTGYIAVNPSTTYHFESEGAATQWRSVEYAEGKEYKSKLSPAWADFGTSYTTDSSTHFIRVVLRKGTGTTAITPSEVTNLIITEV